MKDTLEKLLFFSCLTDSQMLKVMQYIDSLALKTGDILFEEEENGDYVCFIVSGSLEIMKQNSWHESNAVIDIIYQGGCIGEMALIDHETRSATVRAHENTLLAILTQNTFETLVASDPVLGVNIVKGVALVLSDNLRNTTRKLADEVAA